MRYYYENRNFTRQYQNQGLNYVITVSLLASRFLALRLWGMSTTPTLELLSIESLEIEVLDHLNDDSIELLELEILDHLNDCSIELFEKEILDHLNDFSIK